MQGSQRAKAAAATDGYIGEAEQNVVGEKFVNGGGCDGLCRAERWMRMIGIIITPIGTRLVGMR